MTVKENFSSTSNRLVIYKIRSSCAGSQLFEFVYYAVINKYKVNEFVQCVRKVATNQWEFHENPEYTIPLRVRRALQI